MASEVNNEEKNAVVVQQQPRTKASQPVLRREIELFTMQSQRVADRYMDRVAYSLFSLELILQIIAEREQVNEVEALITTRIGDLQEAASSEISRLQVLMKKCELTDEDAPEYTRPQVRQIFITSPLVMHFSKLLKHLDYIVVFLDTLWMNGQIDNQHHINATREWQSRLQKLGQYIVSIEGQARRNAYKAGKKEQVEKVAPQRKFKESDSDDDGADDSQVEKEQPPTSTTKHAEAKTAKVTAPPEEAATTAASA